jgi:hypothetical protein
MYDTVSVLIDQPPRSILDSPGWQRERVVTNRETGERQTWGILNAPSGLACTLLPDGRLKVERSLPKSLTGQNVEDLQQSDVADAVTSVDREVARVFSTLALPSVADAIPVRVDYCQSTRLGSEDAVRVELRRLSTLELPRKGHPVRGESGSVAWPRGAIRPKVYSKWLETRGQESAYGVLRYEVGAYRVKAFRTLLGWSSDRPVALQDVLTADVRAKVMTRYAGALMGGYAMGHELNDMRFAAEMIGFCGVRRTATLLGHAWLWHLAGEPAVKDIDPTKSPFGSSATHYRVVGDFRKLRDHLTAKGYDVGQEDEGMRGVVRILERSAVA